MDKALTPILVFSLPEWAQWHAWVDLNSNLKIQILNIKYPRWDSSFYPIFLDQDNKPLNQLTNDLSKVAHEGGLWQSCPELIYFSDTKLEIVIDSKWDGDHPRPAGSQRQLISLSNFKTQIVESHVASYGPQHTNPAGDIIPMLSELSSDFQEKKVYFFNQKTAPQQKTQVVWPVEKKRSKSLKKS